MAVHPRDGSIRFDYADEGEPGYLPAFQVPPWRDGLLTPLPNPGSAFGLFLDAKGVTDKGLKELARFKSLQALALSRNPLTDTGLKELAGLQNLRVLELDETGVTDAGLAELAALKSLKSLRLEETQVTGGDDSAGQTRELERAGPFPDQGDGCADLKSWPGSATSSPCPFTTRPLRTRG